ncbi:MAG: DPP IV N-terminal domain-containing protein, partial [Hymenobacteraceae bacterium]|nr:DPP IV N-terminal domain-containing protein [Hymenobacteraceae bacterium]
MLFFSPHPVARAAPFVVVLALLAFPAAAQGKKNLTMAEAVLARGLMPKNLSGLSFIPQTGTVTYVRGEGDQETLVSAPAEARDEKNEQIVLTKAAFRTALTAAGADGKTLGFGAAHWLTGGALAVTAGTTLYHLDPKTAKATRQTSWVAEAENAEADPTDTRVAYTKAQNLFVSAPGADNVAVTTEANPAIVNGQAAHRSEFGITKGTFWSPTGQRLAFYRMDQTMVTDYPLVDIGELPAQQKAIKYPMAGGKSHHVTVGVYNVAAKSTVFLQTGEPAEQYLTNISWAPDEKSIYVAIVNRGQNELKLNQYDAGTGAFVRTLFEEKDARYTEPEHGLTFIPKKPQQFIWQSRRDGFRHLYLYDVSGKLVRQLTRGDWEVTDLLGFADNGQQVVYSGTADSPLERHTYAVPLSGGELRKITQGTGTHTTQLTDDGRWLLDNFTSSVTPRTIRVVEVASAKPRRLLLKADDPTAAYALGELKLFPIKAADGQTDLYCRLITPPNYDPAKKYPAVIYVYGGPHVQLVTDSWLGGGNLWMQLMAEKGYVVLTVDSRGSGNRGLKFEQATFRKLGTEEMADQLKGVDYLKSLPYVDPARIGVHGWSFGGFMTTTVLTRTLANSFKAGVAGGPVIDWKFYE